MHIELTFRNSDGDLLEQVSVCADTATEASEGITHVLIEMYAKHGPGVSITPNNIQV